MMERRSCGETMPLRRQSSFGAIHDCRAANIHSRRNACTSNDLANETLWRDDNCPDQNKRAINDRIGDYFAFPARVQARLGASRYDFAEVIDHPAQDFRASLDHVGREKCGKSPEVRLSSGASWLVAQIFVAF